MFLRITELSSKKLIGLRIRTNLVNNQTVALWQRFRPLLKTITNGVGSDLISLQVYDTTLTFDAFTPQTFFETWAAKEVSDFDNVPEGLETYTLTGGLYAVFLHKGTPAQFPETSDFIYSVWLPESGYEVDQREHFAVMPPAYRPNDPEAEEETWVPVRVK